MLHIQKPAVTARPGEVLRETGGTKEKLAQLETPIARYNDTKQNLEAAAADQSVLGSCRAG